MGSAYCALSVIRSVRTNEQEIGRPWTEATVKELMTRNSAIADKPRDAVSGQLRSPNMIPFHILGMVSY